MIETPTATAYTSPTTDADSTEIDATLLSPEQKSEKQTLQALEAELFLVKRAPITAKLRTAVKHLKAVGGRWSRFRGLHVMLIYHAIHSLIVNLVAGSSGEFLARPVMAVFTTIALCRLQMTWTHIVISNPNSKRWFRRIPSVKAGKNIIVPTAVFAIAQQAAMYVPRGLFNAVMDSFNNPEAYGGNPKTVQKIAVVQLFFVALIAIGTVFLIVIPADVTLKRVQASMLPEEDESIVPFDRSFAGKVKPEILGGSGSVSMLDAWKTFDKEARIRLIKLYLKIFAIQVATTIMFVMIAVSELGFIMGDDLRKMAKDAHAQLKGQ